jgi:hypothetical protein
MRFPLLDDSSRIFGTAFLGKLADEQKLTDGPRFPLISQMVEQKPIR